MDNSTMVVPIIAILNGNQVTIIEDNPSSALVRVAGDDGDDFSVMRSKLKFPKPKGPEAVYVSQAVPASMQNFVTYLQSVPYSLHVICRSDDQVLQAQAEYAMWSATPQNPKGDQMPPNTIKQYPQSDSDDFDRCWCLDFPYSPAIDYPFSVLLRGTGERKPNATGSVAWLSTNSKRIESRYVETAELVVRGGLRAFKK